MPTPKTDVVVKYEQAEYSYDNVFKYCSELPDNSKAKEHKLFILTLIQEMHGNFCDLILMMGKDNHDLKDFIVKLCAEHKIESDWIFKKQGEAPIN